METWPHQEFLFIFKLVAVPSIVLLWTDVNRQPFTCRYETTCTRFKHSFISIKACCSIRNMFPSYLNPDAWASFLYPLSFVHYHEKLVSEWHWVAYIEDRFSHVAIMKWSIPVASVSFHPFFHCFSVKVKDKICANSQNQNNKNKHFTRWIASSVLSATLSLCAVSLIS